MIALDLEQLRAKLEQPILLLGGTGMLGRMFQEILRTLELRFDAPGRSAIDLASGVGIASVAGGPWKVIINCAAWTNVDGAEKDEAGATAVNAEGVRALAEAARSVRALVVNYTTDYIFSGESTTPYRFNARREPLNAYGRSKAKGEEALERVGCRFLNIRTSWLYAPWGKNFVRTIAKAAKDKPALKVVNDQRGRPTSSEHLARATLALIAARATGHQHVTDGPSGEPGCTWFEFATEIARFVNPACRVDPCATADFPRPAKRPAYSVLDLTRTESLIGPMPSWRINLADVLARLEP